MRVEIQLDLDTARELHTGAAGARTRGNVSSGAASVRQVARELGVTVAPVHPGQTHEFLAPFFFVDAPDRATAERVAKRLQKVKGVEAAWVRPSDELP
jgi:hypothetical protein